MLVTLDEGAAFGLLANVGNQRQNFHQNIVLSDSVDHQFLQKVNKPLIDQQNIRPFLPQFRPRHDSEQFQTHFAVFGLCHQSFYNFIANYSFHIAVNFIGFA